MTDSLSTTSLRAAFSFPFRSPGWGNRFLIGAVLLLGGMFVPLIPTLFVYGYMVEVMRQAIRGEEPVLPEWQNWGKLLRNGLRSLAVGVVYLGPGLAIIVGGWLLYMVMYFGGMILIATRPEGEVFPGIIFLLMVGAMGVLFLSFFVGWFLSMVGAVPLPAALAHFVAHDKFSAAFRVREWGAVVRADKWGYFIGWVVVLGLVGVLYMALMLMYATLILCVLVYFVAAPIGFYLLLVSAVVFGQFYREGATRAGLLTV